MMVYKVEIRYPVDGGFEVKAVDSGGETLTVKYSSGLQILNHWTRYDVSLLVGGEADHVFRTNYLDVRGVRDA